MADPYMEMGLRTPYTGPIPIVTHLHGGEVPSQFDGGPEAWFTSNGLRGSAYASLAGAAQNAAIYEYLNQQEATTLWFHDHALGITRLNVYAGLAAFCFLRDDRDTGLADNPIGLPAGEYEHEIVIQDRQFDINGQWLFPDGSPSGLNGEPPNPDVHPFWNPEFFGDVIVVNGKSWPYMNVEPRRYRFRFLDGSNARFYELRVINRGTKSPGPAFWIIGTDGGLLDKPVMLNDPKEHKRGRLLELPGTRDPADTPIPGFTADGDTTFNPELGTLLRTPMVRLANPAAGTLAAGVAPEVKRQLVLVPFSGRLTRCNGALGD